MFFQHVYDKTLAQASYFIGCQKAGVAMVIDPKRDVDTYLEIAKANNMKITHIAETHIHADFLSGARELAALTGGELYLSAEGGNDWSYEFNHNGVKDGDVIMVGNLKIEVLHTPGHTPESISFLLTDVPASPIPVMIFTGDFVFVGDVGRPDLLEKAAGMTGTQDIGAKQMYQSIQRFSKLGDHIQVWPGHGAGSACGKSLGAVPSSTIGYEKIRNWAFQYENDEAGFIEYLLKDQPEPPKYFAMMKKLNKVDRPLLTEVPKYKELSAEEFLAAYHNNTKIVDTRLKADFAAGFIPKTINIQGNNAFATWAGWFVSYDESIILVAAPDQLDDLARKLMRIGLDNVVGYISSTKVWEDLGHKLEKANVVDLPTFQQMKNQEDVQVVDVRGVSEYSVGHIHGTKNLFVGYLPQTAETLDKNKTLLIHCQSGDRATIAYSLLLGLGFDHVYNYSGGMNEWVAEGNQVEFE